ALTAGDPDSAEEAIQTIDRHLLDTAVNTHFMRIRLRDQFRDWSGVATYRPLPELMRLRVPHLIRMAVLRGLHGHYLAAPEMRGEVQEAARLYRISVHPIVSEQLLLCRPEDGLEVRRCLGYRAWVLKDAREARRLLESSPDPLLAPLLQLVVAE